jgi:radical SAM protein with 4Fe4S-binding SPASM domain
MSNFYCAAPWRGLHINPRGDVKPCCAGNPNMLGNLNNKSIHEILNGPKLTEIRSALQQGQYHEFCQGCRVREDRGGTSERTWHNDINQDFNPATTGLEYHYPTLLDIRWNSTCNLSCNYCGPLDSSKWAALKKMPINNNTRNYYLEVCEFIENNNQHVKEVALVGGEPLLLPENERLLDVIPADAVITIITNLNNPLENNRIFQKLAQRRKVGWSMSFDNINSRFEYVRSGASWDLQLHNLDLVQDLMRNNGHWGGIHAVYNLYNATRLVEFKQFATARGLSIKWQYLTGPKPLNPRNYGQEVATLAAKEIEHVFKNCIVDDEERLLFGTALEYYQSVTENNSESLIHLQKFIVEMEQYHPDQQGKFYELWPEISNLL